MKRPTDLNLENEETNDIRSLRKAEKLRAKLYALEREIAFAKVGIQVYDPRMNNFIKGYDGELDPETIRETAIQAGFIAPPQQAADPAVKAQQQQASGSASCQQVQVFTLLENENES